MNAPPAADSPSAYQDDQWWRHHFSGPMLALWQAIVPLDRATEDADFLQQHLGLVPGMHVLDVPCGEGRVGIELASRGLRVSGVDISPGLLAIARRRAAALGLDLHLREADMRELPADAGFEGAFCWGDSFGYLDEAGNAGFLRAVAATLRPGAGFALEVQMVDELLQTRFRAEARGQVDGMDLHIQRQWNRRQGRLAVQYALTREGQVHRCHASYRIHTLVEMQALLRAAGFGRVQALDMAGQPFGPKAQRLRLVAHRDGA